MNISGLIRSVLNDMQASEPKVLELKVGEVVKGMVLQLLSETDAIINIGGVQVRAKLETPLKQGEVTLLQVQPENSSGQMVLKPLGASVVQIADGSLAEVLKNVGLPDNAINRQIIQTLHQSGVPLSRDNVQAFSQLQSQLPAAVSQEDWIPAAVVAFQKGIPLSGETVTALKQVITGPAFHETLQQLDDQMTKLLSDNQNLSTSTRSAIDAFKGVVAVVKEASSELMPNVASLLSDTEVENMLTATKEAGRQQNASQASVAAPNDMDADIQQAAKMSGTSPSGAAAGFNQAGSTLLAGEASSTSPKSTLLQADTLLTKPDPAFNAAAEDGPSNSAIISKTGSQSLEQISTLTKSAANLTQTQTLPSSLLGSGTGILTDNSGRAVEVTPVQPTVTNSATAAALNNTLKINPEQMTSEQLRETAVRPNQTQSTANNGTAPTLPSDIQSDTSEHWISKLIKAVGVEHEQAIFKLPEKNGLDSQLLSAASLSDRSSDLQAPAGTQQDPLKSVDTLKSALLMLVQSDDTPAALKETAQQAIQQITGQQLLLNTDRTSAFSNITMFIPIINANGEQTAAIHIQSRKGARGEIDANNCRLVFDLRMKALGDTMIDVQVVDRIVSLRVLNDQPFIQPLLESHREEIAASLSKIGYQFISLKCSPYPEKAQPTEEKAAGSRTESNLSSQIKSLYGKKPYKGMDVRV
ncbi:hypothetical protein OB236_24705 [Paenibacillus sp. WQ 127069]|uniref:Flagellar hook-length control protein FliK n=1 Tax=Paenibacillus baimaensis TaxID=2982185 RepID=A0ABT2UL01_9BACL|nr:hypothetical protein [Paenibacillus sp. WQ 127069]MCU6795315.1 hypothetical protein [Paenibacillus sp. WQ 127069]